MRVLCNRQKCTNIKTQSFFSLAFNCTMETCWSCKTLKSQNTWSKQFKRFLKNSNSRRCGFDGRWQPIAGRNIFCNIFATFSQNTRFCLWRTQLKRFFENSNSQRSIHDRQIDSNAGKNIFATFLQLFCKLFAKHVFASGQNSLRDFWKIPPLRGQVLVDNWKSLWAKIFFAKFLPLLCKKHIFAPKKFLQKTFFPALDSNCLSKMNLWELKFSKNLLNCVLQRQKRVFCEKVAKILQKIFLPTMGCNRLSKPHLWELEFFKNLLNCVLQVFCDFRVLQVQHVSIVR